MTYLRFAWRLLAAQGMRHLVTAVVIALGLGLMLSAVATVDAARSAMSSAAARFPLVVGGEIGAVPLVLGSLTGLQDLSAGIDHGIFEELQNDQRVECVVPLLGGHAVGGYALLATTPDYLQPRRRYPLSAGRVFRGDAMEVVLGSEAARGLGAELGGAVDIEHQHAGASAEAGSLRVVGILEPTNMEADRTLFCPLGAIYSSHQGSAADGQPARSVSAILVRPQDDAGLLALQEELEGRPGVAVALTGQTLRRISDQLVTGARLLRILVSGVVLITLFSLLLSAYNTALSQTREIGVMRVLGARRHQVVGVVLLVNGLVILAGTLAGLGVAALIGGASEQMLREEAGIEAAVVLLSPTTYRAMAATFAMLALVGLQPAWAAYSVQAADALDEVPGSGRATGTFLRWSLRVVVPLALFGFLFQAMGQHGREVASAPLDASSSALFQSLMSSSTEDPTTAVAADLDGQQLTVQGYMYALGDPFTVQDFYLVAINPRLPRCPFCYRAPTSRERIRIQTAGRTVDLCTGKVTVKGIFRVEPDDADPYQMEMNELDVVLPH